MAGAGPGPAERTAVARPFAVRATRAALHDRRADPLLDDLGRLLPLEVALHALDHVAFDGAHVVAHVAEPHGLEERDERLLIHVELLRDLVDPNLAHAPRSSIDKPDSDSPVRTTILTGPRHIDGPVARFGAARIMAPSARRCTLWMRAT